MDWKWDNPGRDPNKIVKAYRDELKGKHLQKSYISLQHDKGRTDVKANHNRYEKIIKLIKEKGYKFVTMEECLNAPKSAYFPKDHLPNFNKCR